HRPAGVRRPRIEVGPLRSASVSSERFFQPLQYVDGHLLAQRPGLKFFHDKMNLALDYYMSCWYIPSHPCSFGACSRGIPEYGARSGVPRRRLITAAPGGTGPRPPGTTTRTRGARCDRSGTRRSASLGELPVREARDRSLKSPRW